mgnify:CR=1 FL=1
MDKVLVGAAAGLVGLVGAAVSGIINRKLQVKDCKWLNEYILQAEKNADSGVKFASEELRKEINELREEIEKLRDEMKRQIF